MLFIEARFKTKLSGRRIRLNVIHDMEAPETGHTAEDVANWWHGPTSPKTSAHYCYDNDSEVQCVRDQDIAYAAPGANSDGLHHELAGYARQSPEEWRDKFSLATLTRCAINVHNLCQKYNLKEVWLSDKELSAGSSGIVGHDSVSRVYHRSTHTDPGPNFPKDFFIDLVRSVPLLPPPDETRVVLMNDCVAARRCPIDGGLQKLQADGGIFNSDGCEHYHGSYMDPEMAQHRNVPRTAREIVDPPAELGGATSSHYTIIMHDGSGYDF